jgi:hypothetical protein
MFQVTSKLTTALASVALASLPFVAGAQGTGTPQQPGQPRTTSQQSKTPGEQNSPQHHLNEAKRVLNSIDTSSLKGEAKNDVSELRRHFSQLESAWQKEVAGSARSTAGASGHAGGHTATTGAGTTSGATSGTPAGTAAGTTGTPEQTGATGATTRQTPHSGATSGTAPRSTSGASGDWMTHYQAIGTVLDRLVGSAGATASASTNLDADTRSKLVEFRRHIDQFHTTAMGQGRVGEEDAASASAHSGITGAMTPSPTQPSTPAGAHTSAHTQPSTAASGTAAQSSPSMQSSSNAEALARLSAQIDELIGSASTSSTSSTTPSTAASGTTPGAVGTAGTAAVTGTVCVDRAKLEQLKRDIQALQNSPRQ